MTKVKILLLEDDSSFAKLFQDKLIRSLGDNAEKVSIEHYDSVKDECLCDTSFDMYFVDNKINGTEQALDILSQLTSCNKDSCRIYVMSKYGNFDLLKKAWAGGASGFIDKDDVDYKGLSKTIGIIHENKRITEKLRLKMNNLSKKKVFNEVAS